MKFFSSCNNKMLYETLKLYNKNKHIIKAYVAGDTLEGYAEDMKKFDAYGGVLGFLVFLLFIMLVWIYAIYLLMNNWRRLSKESRVLAIFGLVSPFGGPLLTILVVFFSRK